MRTDTPEAAAAALLHGRGETTVLAAMSPQLPDSLVRALIARARQAGIRLTLLIADLSAQWSFLDDAALDDVRAGRLRLRMVAGGVPAALASAVDQVVGSMWDIDRMIGEGDLRIDVFVARAGIGGPGRATFGDMVGYSATALRTSARVGLELVAGGPLRPADPVFSLDRAMTAVDGGPYIPWAGRSSGPMPGQREVARRAAALIPDGATLQTGLGAVPSALFEELADKKALGIHSGILPGDLQRLISAGVATGERKNDAPGLHVATGVLGGDPGGWGERVRLEPLAATHDPARLRALANLWAVNSAFEIDLSGQVNAEYVGARRVASAGGQADFMRAAHLSPGGAAVIALPARTARGRSRIVARLPRAHVPAGGGPDLDWVVTEAGAVRLRGLSVEERAHALIGVAAPEHRAELLRSWQEGMTVRSR